MQLAIPPQGETAARRFYGDILQLAEIAKPALLAERGGCWFAAGALQVHLGVQPHFAPARRAHPAFLVADLARLEAAGYPVEPDAALPDRPRFYSTDPFGNRLEFVQDGAGFSQGSGLAGRGAQPAT